MPQRSSPPFRTEPRFDPKPWGGRGLERLGLSPPDDGPIGEAVVSADDAVVAGGRDNGRSLAELVAADPVGVAGRRGLAVCGERPLFPLVVKLIDAVADLSIQVHPDDGAAAVRGQTGKTEAYHVLAAAPGARIALGIRGGVSRQEFAARCRAGERLAPLLRWLPAVPGQTIVIPAGTVHALGAGCLVYEVQQPCDITYRLDDWGRVDAGGHRRPLHVEDGLAVVDPGSRPEPIPPLPVRSAVGRRQILAACRFFALERIALAAGETVEAAATDAPQVMTCLRGAAAVATAGGALDLSAGGASIVPAAGNPASLAAREPTVLLRAWVPDLSAEIVAPLRAAGHPGWQVARLSGPLADLGELLAD